MKKISKDKDGRRCSRDSGEQSRVFQDIRDFCESFPFREIFKSGSASLSKSRRIHVFPNLSISGGAFARRTLWMRSSRSSMQPAVLSEHTTLCTSQSEAAKQMETKLGYVGYVGYICAIWNLTAVLFDFKCVLRYVSGGARPSPFISLPLSLCLAELQRRCLALCKYSFICFLFPLFVSHHVILRLSFPFASRRNVFPILSSVVSNNFCHFCPSMRICFPSCVNDSLSILGLRYVHLLVGGVQDSGSFGSLFIP